MPGNGRVFEAFTLCGNQLKREWFNEQKKRVFKPVAIDNTGVYHTLLGAGLLDDETFISAIEILNHFLALEKL